MKQSYQHKQKQIQTVRSYAQISRKLEVLSMPQQDLHRLLEQLSGISAPLSLEDAMLEVMPDRKSESLEAHILDQVRFRTDLQSDVMEYLLSFLDGNGWFDVPRSKLDQYPDEVLDYHIEQARALDPAGCFCFSLKDCLQIQCELSEKAESETGLILCDHLELLAERNWQKLKDVCEMSVEEVMEGLTFIRSLNLRPGAAFARLADGAIADCEVVLEEDRLVVRMENPFSKDGAQDEQGEEAMPDDRNTELDFLRRAIESRQRILKTVMEEAVQGQADWFLSGGPIQRMKLKSLAQKLCVHPSTITRTVSGKYFRWKGRLYPMRMLFDATGTGEMSASAIEKRLMDYIKTEDACEPYSDEMLRLLLEQEGVVLSRRAIAKYRAKLHIPSSYQRKNRSLS